MSDDACDDLVASLQHSRGRLCHATVRGRGPGFEEVRHFIIDGRSSELLLLTVPDDIIGVGASSHSRPRALLAGDPTAEKR